MIHGYAVPETGAKQVLFDVDPGPRKTDAVDIDATDGVTCHSDPSIMDNTWQKTVAPLALDSGKTHYRVVSERLRRRDPSSPHHQT